VNLAEGTTAGDLSVGSVQFPKPNQTLFFWSDIVRYVATSAINLVILLVGIAIGVALAPRIEKPVSAHPQMPQSSNTGSASGQKESDVQFEEITPGIAIGSLATSTLLAHRIATDQLMVNGYDILALDEGVINLLKEKGLLKYRELDALIERSKVPHPLRVKMPPQAPPTQGNPIPEQKKP
jgi:hypothetical protein